MPKKVALDSPTVSERVMLEIIVVAKKDDMPALTKSMRRANLFMWNIAAFLTFLLYKISNVKNKTLDSMILKGKAHQTAISHVVFMILVRIR
jgi:hypothetical protein